MIAWPKRAARAVVKLFEQLQDIDVYVEDENDEVFYREVLGRLTEGKFRLARVFALGNKSTVLEAARNYSPESGRPSLFLIDGDFEWVRSEDPPIKDRWLHRLNAYCIENLVICEAALSQIISDECAIPFDEAEGRLGWEEFVTKVEKGLVDLFMAYAALNAITPQIPTVSTGVGKLCRSLSSTRHELDQDKVAKAIKGVLDQAIAAASKEHVEDILNRCRSTADRARRRIDVISGKDFLIPLISMHLSSLGVKSKKRVLRFKLGRYCSLEGFEAVRDSLFSVAKG